MGGNRSNTVPVGEWAHVQTCGGCSVSGTEPTCRHQSYAGLKSEITRWNLMSCSIYPRTCNCFLFRDHKSLKSDCMSFDCTSPPQPSAMTLFIACFPKSLAATSHLQTFHLPWVHVHSGVNSFFFFFLQRKCGSLRQVGRIDNSTLMTNPDSTKIKWWTEPLKDISRLLQGPARWLLQKQMRRTPNSSIEIRRGQRLRKTQKIKI